MHRLLMVVTALAVTAAFADDTVPLQVQAVFFKKLLGYDQTLEDRGDMKVLVVHADDGAEEGDAVVRAFRAAGMTASAVKVSAAAAEITATSVVYVIGSGPATAVKDTCVKQKALSISGVAAQATSGQVGIALGKKADGKPEIVVNLPLVKAQGHRLSAALLNLARVIQ